MRNHQPLTGAQRVCETGLLWKEVLTNGSGSVEVVPYSTVRVRANAGITITIDGVLAATMATNEVMLFNVGPGNTADTKSTVTVAASGNCYMQIGREV